MWLVLAHPRDEGARRLVHRWAPRAQVLTVRDVCAPGWRFEPGGPTGSGQLAVGGNRIAVAELSGVVTRIPGVEPADLPHIVEADRGYVAAELHAFLTAWLDALPCPVINRPSAASLLGPALSHERWLALAARSGLRLVSAHHRAPVDEHRYAPVVVTVVGDRWFGAPDAEVGAQAVRLARSAGVDLLTARFTGVDHGAAFASADLFIDVTDEIADALAAWAARDQERAS